MSEKILNSRIILKHDTEENWSKASFIPRAGEIVIYDIDQTHSIERMKIGDGTRNINSLPFADANKVDKVSGKGLSTNDYTTADKDKLAGIAEGANKTVVDSELSTSSTNPVQNKVVNTAISNLMTLVGDKTVSEQINSAINEVTADDFGIYVQATEPANAVAGDIWVDTANDPSFIVPTIPEVTQADNGKVLMVVNGKYQLVKLNLSVDANGVVSM